MTKTDNSKAARSREEVLRASVNYVAPAGGVPFEDRDVHRLAEVRRFMTLAELPLQCREFSLPAHPKMRRADVAL